MQEIVDLDRRGELEPLLGRLALYAFDRLRHLTWRGASVRHNGTVPGGSVAQDFVQIAITKALDETRIWNRDKYPTLEHFLRSSIKSEINHLAESLDNVRGRRLAAPHNITEPEITYEPPGTEPDPLSVVADDEWRQRYRAAVWRALDGDSLLLDLLRCYEAAVTKPGEIAQRLGRPISQIYDALRRFRRKLADVDAAMNRADEETGGPV